MNTHESAFVESFISKARRERAMGAPDTFHVIGGEHDGKDMELLAALKQIMGYGTGTMLSCIPGKLAYFEGEIRERFLLVRT
jgi:hypothetical protein